MNKTAILKLCTTIIPNLTQSAHKGSNGRIGVIGGSLEYTGGPYFAAISALKAGSDLVHVFCCQSAAPVIKSYSPELIVHPLLDVDYAVSEITPWLHRLHALVIGPGLGRNKVVLNNVLSIIKYIKSGNIPSIPIVIDADGLFLLLENMDLFQNYKGHVIMTPNKMEFQRFGERLGAPSLTALELSTKIGAVVVQKGATDVITCTIGKPFICDEEGSPRRCGGQGDVLAGVMATFAAWQAMHKVNLANKVQIENNFGISAYAACILTRRCSKLAFAKYKRSMVAGNLIEFIHTAFEELFDE